MAENLLSSHHDIFFTILLLLPTDTLLRVQTVCRARVISDPAFVRAHCSRPAPITAFFTPRDRFTSSEQWFKPNQDSEKFPSSISGILSSGFKVASRNHGILCFRRNMVFIVGNPVTSSWSVLRYAAPNSSSFRYHGVALIYDPTISQNFKLALAFINLDEEGEYCIQFHIYSSETCAWTISSEFIQRWPWFDPINEGIWESARYEPCNIGGGSVCCIYWIERFGFLVGYEISSDTYWETRPPLPSLMLDQSGLCLEARGSGDMSSYDGFIYFTGMDYDVAKVWRLEGKNNWVLEDGSGEELGFDPHWFAYDCARRVLLIGDRTQRELLALHLSCSRLEILYQGDEFPNELFNYPLMAHGNTLARLGGAGSTGMDGLAREFRSMGLSPLDL